MLSRAHPLARRLRALRTDAALRAREGVLVAEGIHLAMEALASSMTIEAAVVSPRLADSDEGRELARRLAAAGVPVHETSPSTLDGLQDARSPQPVVIIVRRASPELAAAVPGRGGSPLLVVACGVQDPGNLGALLRTSDAAGATGFAAASGGAGLTHPRAVRASMGALFRLPAVEAPLPAILEAIRAAKLTIIGAAARGETAYDAFDWGGRIALLLGGEGGGLPPEAQAALELSVAIPMAAGVESLSVNAAAAVLLFEASRRRRAISPAG